MVLVPLILALAGAPQATIHFERVAEPREGAFSLLVPRGWITEGGITRVNPLTSGGAANAIAAKLNFVLKRDAAGTVLMHWLPDTLYMDMRGMPAAPMFPPGSNYNGMTVMPVQSAAAFLLQVAFRQTHPGARNTRVVEQQSMPSLVAQAQRMAASLPIGGSFRYDAAMVSVEYEERGVRYLEKLLGLIENMGAAGAGMWSNKQTMRVRAPAAEFARTAAILAVVQGSVEINPQWLIGEIRGQLIRSGIAAQTLRELQRLDREIVENTRRTNAEINHSMYLNLTGQEEYINPHTKRVEVGSNQWNYRWETATGGVIYTDLETYDPNRDPASRRSDWRRSPVRKR